MRWSDRLDEGGQGCKWGSNYRVDGKRSPRGGERLTTDNVAVRSPGPPPVPPEGGGVRVGAIAWMKGIRRSEQA
jgi:hypothetical protein